MPYCGHRDCDHCGEPARRRRESEARRQRRAERRDPKEAKRLAGLTQKRVTDALLRLAKTVTVTPSEHGPRWQTLTIDGYAATGYFGNGALYMRTEAGKAECWPMPKKSRGWAQVQRLYTEVVDQERLAKERAEVRDRSRRLHEIAMLDAALRAAEEKMRAEARERTKVETQAAFDALVKELGVEGQIRFIADSTGRGSVFFGMHTTATPEQAKQIIDRAVTAGVLMPQRRLRKDGV